MSLPPRHIHLGPGWITGDYPGTWMRADNHNQVMHANGIYLDFDEIFATGMADAAYAVHVAAPSEWKEREAASQAVHEQDISSKVACVSEGPYSPPLDSGFIGEEGRSKAEIELMEMVDEICAHTSPSTAPDAGFAAFADYDLVDLKTAILYAVDKLNKLALTQDVPPHLTYVVKREPWVCVETAKVTFQTAKVNLLWNCVTKQHLVGKGKREILTVLEKALETICEARTRTLLQQDGSGEGTDAAGLT
ncbi:hypothetical protein LTR09_002503 [Extremus antarcticus]|uniref:Uncharacterized protein n=1 Tax=Extremus antarcticus TaxID=702011 RepID=A0AAJ0LVC9_9PEZI|nr:hypothetical protein LTR09_002503 [Extremus antarcticus]